jgi:hypothetical protein
MTITAQRTATNKQLQAEETPIKHIRQHRYSASGSEQKVEKKRTKIDENKRNQDKALNEQINNTIAVTRDKTKQKVTNYNTLDNVSRFLADSTVRVV